MKKIMMLGALLLAVAAWGDTAEIDGRTWTYFALGKSATIISATQKSGAMVIPAAFASGANTYVVTGIANGAFANDKMTSVTIPTNVTSIGEGAFAGCKGLKSATIPQCVCTDGIWSSFDAENLVRVVISDGVTEIGDEAFAGCYNLESVALPSSLEAIGDYAFESCYALKRVKIPNSVGTLGDGVFQDCFDLESVTLPNGITKITESMFAGCYSLTSVNIPSTVCEIYPSAFAGCQSLARLILPSELTAIGAYAFADSGLTTLAIPSTVTTLGEGAFSGCRNLAAVTITQKMLDLGVANLFDTDLAAVLTIADGVTEIASEAFKDFKNIISVTLPDSVEQIGARAFYNCCSLVSVNLPKHVWRDDQEDVRGVQSIGTEAFANCRSLTAVEIPESVQTVGSHAFANCYALKDVSLPCSVFDEYYHDYHCQLRDDVFMLDDSERLRAWENVTVQFGVTKVGGFGNCPNLKTVVLPATVRNISSCAFRGCTKLESVTISDEVYEYWDLGCYEGEIGECAFEGCVSLTHVDIPEQVTRIGNSAFRGCRSLTAVELPEAAINGWGDIYAYGVRFIDNSAFEDCTSLVSVNFPGRVWNAYENHWMDETGLQNIGSFAFGNCTSLLEANLPECLSSIGEHAFENCYSLKDVALPECLFTGEYGIVNVFYFNDSSRPRAWENVTVQYGVTTINGFGNCPNLKTVVLPSTVISIGDGAFQNCSKLESVTIADEVDWDMPQTYGYEGQIGGEAFYGCVALKEVDIPQWVTRIGPSAFHGCRSLVSVTLPERMGNANGSTYTWGVRWICDSAFYGCTSLERVNFPERTWDAQHDCWHDDGLRQIGAHAFENCTSLVSAEVPECLEEIGDRAFANCYSLKDVTLPYCVYESKRWRSGASESCNGLQYVFELDNDNRSRAWENVTVQYGATTINGFGNCPELRTVVLPASVRDIGSGAFKNCVKLESVTIADEVDWDMPQDYGYEGQIEAEAFKGCVALKEVDIPQWVTWIGPSAFYGCRSLVSVTLPERTHNASGTTYTWGVRWISDSAFYGCTSLERVNFPERTWDAQHDCWHDDGLRQIGAHAFENCTSLVSAEVPECLEEIGDRAFANCYSLKDVSLPYCVYESKRWRSGESESCNGLQYVFELDNDNRSRAWENVTVQYGVTMINGFGNCPELRTVVLPASVRDIGSGAFANCAKLESVTIADEVDWNMPQDYGYEGEIEAEAFKGCVALKEVDIPQWVTTIGPSAFYGCRSLVSVTLPERTGNANGSTYTWGVRWICDSAFYGCTSLERINLPERTWDAQYDCWNEDGLRQIGAHAFENCTSLVEAELPECLEEIGDRAFANCYSLKDVSLTEAVFYFYSNWDISYCYLRGDVFAFDNSERTRAWENVVVGYGVTQVGCFGNCPNLKRVVLPASVVGIEDRAFWNCAKLESVTIADGLQTAMGYDEWQRRIGMEAFAGCTSLVRVDIPEGVTRIEISAFRGCSSLVDAVLPDSVMDLGSSAFLGCSALKSVNLPEGVWSPDSGEYVGGVRQIGENAFDGCVSLTSVEIPECVEEIEWRAFGNCVGLKDLVLPKRVFDRGLRDVFYWEPEWYGYSSDFRPSWENVTIGGDVTNIAAGTFQGLPNLKTVTLARSVRGIGEGAFADCPKLVEVVIPPGVAEIGAEAFAGCGRLPAVSLPNSITNIGDRAFADCGELMDVVFAGDAPMVGAEVFEAVDPYCIAWVEKGSRDWNVNIPGTWQGIGIQYLPYYSYATCRENLVTMQTSAGLKVTSVEGAPLTQADLNSVKISAMMMTDGSETDTTKGYRSNVSSDGKTALFTLVEPTVGTAAEAEAQTDPDDPSGQLVEVPESQVAAKPAMKAGEELGALPAKAVKGLWYQASWGTDLGNMTQGAKIQATGDTLYLGVIKQTGSSGFYRVIVTEQ